MLIDQMIKEVLLLFLRSLFLPGCDTFEATHTFRSQNSWVFFTFSFTVNSFSTLNGNVITPNPKQPMFMYHRQLAKHCRGHPWICLLVTSLNQAKQQLLHEGLVSLYFSHMCPKGMGMRGEPSSFYCPPLLVFPSFSSSLT